jgi:hypothetical protein
VIRTTRSKLKERLGRGRAMKQCAAAFQTVLASNPYKAIRRKILIDHEMWSMHFFHSRLPF